MAVPPLRRSFAALRSSTLSRGRRGPGSTQRGDLHPEDRSLPAVAQLQQDDMEDTKTRNGRERPKGDVPGFGVVTVISKPAPDAEDRLRRLFTLLLGFSSGDGQEESGKDPTTDDRHADDHAEAEA